MSQLQEEVHLLRQMKDMLTKDLEEAHGGKSPEILSATELKVQLAQKEQELARAKEALQGKKAPAIELCVSLAGMSGPGATAVDSCFAVYSLSVYFSSWSRFLHPLQTDLPRGGSSLLPFSAHTAPAAH